MQTSIPYFNSLLISHAGHKQKTDSGLSSSSPNSYILPTRTKSGHEINLPIQALINHFSPSDHQLWNLQRKNEELEERLYETHVILDAVMEKHRNLQNILVNFEKNLNSGDCILVPKKDLLTFRENEKKKAKKLEEKLNDTMNILLFASDLLDCQYINRDEQIEKLKTQKDGLQFVVE